MDMVRTHPVTGRDYLLHELEYSCSWTERYKNGYLFGATWTVINTRKSWEQCGFRLDLPSGEIIIKRAKSVLAAKRAITKLMRCAGMSQTHTS